LDSQNSKSGFLLFGVVSVVLASIMTHLLPEMLVT
jgi:hypothetical protein